MSSDIPDVPDDIADRITRVRIEDEMEQSYIDYAMSVIAGRALPDVRDGLKPVHRRILYSMHREGVTSGSGHRKASSIVGATMGDYHPHGDSAIYDALVRMAQEFSLRYPLIDGQGNFGSLDGDPPAAMRYTEARMAPIAEEFLADIEKETVDFEPNYDDRLEEPTVLPAKVPGFLVNGSSGIAVGMSTNTPPHNLGEIIDATIHLIDHPDCSVRDLIDLPGDPGLVTGPDFPTGAEIVGRSGIVSAYETGRGRLRVRASYEIESRDAGDRIVVREIPYQVNKASMVETIADLVNDGAIEGVTDLRDESDRDGVRVVIELGRNANTDVVENQLLDRVFETTFGVITLAIVDGQPQILTLKDAIEHYLAYRREVVRRRSEFELSEAEDRAHLLEGRLHALEHVDAVVELIRNSQDRPEAISNLQVEFEFSERQAEHIVRMQLGSLTSLETVEIEDEYEAVLERIEWLETVLGDETELLGVIKTELQEIRDEYADDRRTRIVESTGPVEREDLIPEEEVLIVVTADDYVKRMAVEQFSPQHRGGKGIIGTELKDGDRVSTVFRANSHDYLLCFTTYGKVYQIRAYEIPEMGRTARGKSAVNLLDLDGSEEISAVLNTADFDDDEYLTMVTRRGKVTRTDATEFERVLSTGIIAMRLDDVDELVDVEVTDGSTDLLVATRRGMTIRFAETEVPVTGRRTKGVNAMKLRECDRVVGMVSAREDDDRYLLTVTERGYGKRTSLTEYRPQARYGYGLVDIKTTERNGDVASVKAVEAGDHFIVICQSGQIMRTRAEEVSVLQRNTMGVRIMDAGEDDLIAAVDVLPAGSIAESGDGVVVEHAVESE